MDSGYSTEVRRLLIDRDHCSDNLSILNYGSMRPALMAQITFTAIPDQMCCHVPTCFADRLKYAQRYSRESTVVNIESSPGAFTVTSVSLQDAIAFRSDLLIFSVSPDFLSCEPGVFNMVDNW